MAEKYGLEDTIGGSDLSVWYLQEYPDPSDLLEGTPLELCKKQVIMMELDSALSVSYSTMRERFPVRSLGWINAKHYTGGIRTISGHIAFSIFIDDVLSRLRSQVNDEIKKSIPDDAWDANRSEWKDMENVEEAETLIAKKERTKISNLVRQELKAVLLDQLPPFNLLIMGVSERNGHLVRMLLKGVYIIDENQYQGTQQPNIMNKVTFVALDVVPMTKDQFEFTSINGSLTAIEESFMNGKYSYSSMLGNDLTGTGLLQDMRYQSIRNDNNKEEIKGGKI